jgi:hypothetical protein
LNGFRRRCEQLGKERIDGGEHGAGLEPFECESMTGVEWLAMTSAEDVRSHAEVSP